MPVDWYAKLRVFQQAIAKDRQHGGLQEQGPSFEHLLVRKVYATRRIEFGVVNRLDITSITAEIARAVATESLLQPEAARRPVDCIVCESGNAVGFLVSHGHADQTRSER